MATPLEEETPEFRRGWAAAVQAARFWHEGKAKQALVLARRSRFPKGLERDAELHGLSAAAIDSLEPEDP